MLNPIAPLTTFELLERLAIRPDETQYQFCKMYIDNDPPWSGRELMPDTVPLIRKMDVTS